MRPSTCTLIRWVLVTALAVSSTATYAAAQTISWSRQLGTEKIDIANVSADGLGNVFIGGLTLGDLAGTNAGNRDAFLGKYDAAGTLQWMQQFGTVDGDEIRGMSADGLGNVYVVGSTDVNDDDGNGFLSKYDAAGTLQWMEQFGTDEPVKPFDVSIDGPGNIYVAGTTRGDLGGVNAGELDAFISKFDESGTLVWTQQWGTDEGDQARNVSPDGLGNVYVSGITLGDLAAPNTGSFDPFLSKFDTSGTLLWTEQRGTDYDDFPSVAADDLGNAYVATELIVDTGPNVVKDKDALLQKSDPSGTVLWTVQVDSGDWDSGRDVATDAAGNVYLLGMTGGNLGGDNAGGWDAFLSKYDPSGTPIWTTQWGSAGDERFTPGGWGNVSADGLGNLYVAGTTSGSLAGDYAGGGQDIFLTKIVDVGEILGDFDASGELDATDIDLLSTAVREGPYDQAFDLNHDMSLDEEDRRIWIEELAGTLFGDANLNKAVGFDDFLALSDAFGTAGGWAQGDFDGSADVQFPDFLRLSVNFGKSAGATAVPEPSSHILLPVSAVALALCRRRKVRWLS